MHVPAPFPMAWGWVCRSRHVAGSITPLISISLDYLDGRQGYMVTPAGVARTTGLWSVQLSPSLPSPLK